MQVRGLDLAVTVLGTGKPFIWGHGMTWNRALEDETGLFCWNGLADLLQIIRYDARGHGASEASDLATDYHWANLGTDMLGVADAVGATRFIAGGASMGCVTALCAACAAPERIDALFLVVPPTAWETKAARAEVLNDLARVVETQGLAALVEVLKKSPLLPQFLVNAFPDWATCHLRHIAALPERIVPAIFRGAALSNFPPRDQIQTLPMPTLILAWADDASHPVATSTELVGLLPQAQLHVASSVQELQTWPDLLRDFVQHIP
jgi:pimeloyl-ACP methyl ester carboxylesterase